MAKLIVDEVSAKTLPVLDSLYKDNEEKFHTVVDSTSGAPLERLLKASIARQTVLGRPLTQESDAVRLMELLIHNNLFSLPGDANEEEFDMVVDVLSEPVRRLMLKMSIIRFNMLTTQS